MIYENTLKARLNRGETSVTTGISFHAPEFIEILLRCETDAISLDAEHGTLDERQITTMAQVCERAQVPVVCRVPSARPEFIQRVLDGGVLGIVVPHVRDAATAQAVVDAVKYPPDGTRGLGNFTHATGYGRVSTRDYLREANRQTLVTVQIEEPEGVDAIDAIVATPGVDCVWIGYNDLAVAMGRPGEADHADVQAAIDHVIAATRAAGRVVQVVSRLTDAADWVDRGATLLSVGWTGFLWGPFREGVATARAARRKS